MVVAPDGSIEPRLAESVESSADAKTWHFKMRGGVEFHNGKTLTAEDALKTMERHSNEDSKSGALGIMKEIESMKADGVRIVIQAAYYDPRHARVVADATGAAVARLAHQAGAIPGTEDWIDMLDYNARTLAAALDATSPAGSGSPRE